MKTLFPGIAAALVCLSQVQAGWITFQNENKHKEGLPCVGSIYGNDNYLISHFDCGATDWNATMCGIHCFPFSSTTCVGGTPNYKGQGESNGLWYQPHGMTNSCTYLGDIFVQQNYTMAGPNVTSCGYIDWPAERNWGTVFDHPGYDVKTDGCWPVDKEPEPKFPKHYGHYFDGARPLSQHFCDGDFAMSCGPNEDPKCEFSAESPIRMNCTITDMGQRKRD